MHWLDATIISAFAVYAVASGFRAKGSAERGLEDYFLAGRGLRGWQAGVSMAATQFAADTPLLVTGLIATAGAFSLWRLWIYAVAFLLMGFLLSPAWRRARVVTDAEFTELRYAGRAAAVLRLFKAIYFGLIFNCAVIAMVLFAAREIFQPFLFWHEWLPSSLYQPLQQIVTSLGVEWTASGTPSDQVLVSSTNNLISMLMLVGVTLLYSTTGGLRGVVRTDIAQFGVMITGTAFYAYLVLDECGGFSGMQSRLAALSAAGELPLSRDAVTALDPFTATAAGSSLVGPAMLGVLGLQWLVQINADGTGYLAQRSMACESDREAAKAAVVFTWLQIALRSLLWLIIGVGLLVVYPTVGGEHMELSELARSREATFVTGMKELLPVGVRGLMLTAMLAALASTLDTHLNWGSSYFANDVYARFLRPRMHPPAGGSRDLVNVSRLANVALLVVSLVVMTQLGSIQTAWRISLLLGSGIGPVLVLRWLWWRITAPGELAALLCSSVFAVTAIASLGDDFARYEAWVLLGIAVPSTLAAVGVSFLGREPDATQRQRFVARVRPPGSWRGDPARQARELKRAILGIALAALSVFCVLVGLATWALGSPVPFELMPSSLYGAALLAVGLALVPAWIVRMHPEDAAKADTDA